MFLYLAVLAYLLSPGVLLRLPPGGNSNTVAITHAVVLAAVYGFTHKLVFKMVA